jgi:hypothetical protein
MNREPLLPLRPGSPARHAHVEAIMAYIEGYNQYQTPFVWSAPVKRSLAKIAKCKEALGTLH